MSSKITISLASFATSVPLPIAKPTSAFFKAGASFTPSPVIPTTKPISSDNLTNLLLSCGRERANTFSLGKIIFTSSSVFSFNSSEVNTISLLLVIIPTSFAIATAVSLLSPVIIIVFIPAFFTKFTPSNQHTNFAITAFDQGINYVNTIEGFAPGHHYSTIGTTYGDLIEKIDFNLGGTKLLDTNDSNIFNTVQPLWYHTAAPRNTGLHCYSFALNPENACPTGCIDFTMINNANVLIKLHNTINTQTVSRNATTFANENIDMDYVFAANYPRMAVSAEVAKSPLFNFVVPNISPIMNGSKIDTLYTYTEGQPVYYYYIYAINYNFLLFSNGMCGLKYS